MRPARLKRAIKKANRLHERDGKRYRVFFFGDRYHVWNRMGDPSPAGERAIEAKQEGRGRLRRHLLSRHQREQKLNDMAFLTKNELKTHLYEENVDVISRNDETILTAAIDAAVQEAKGYLG